MSPMATFNDKNQNSMLNYKIAICKNWEKDKTCRYGNKCSFAHGNEELRKKEDNMKNLANPIPMMFMMDQNGQPIMVPQQVPGMDFSQMTMPVMPGNFDPNQMVMGMMPPFANFPQGGNMETGNKDTGGNNDKNQQ